jgi:hypothetical protein
LREDALVELSRGRGDARLIQNGVKGVRLSQARPCARRHLGQVLRGGAIRRWPATHIRAKGVGQSREAL